MNRVNSLPSSVVRRACIAIGFTLILITITSCGGGCVLGVFGCPQLAVQPQQLSFTASGNGSPPSQQLTVRNSGSGTLQWNAQADQPWLSVSPWSGKLSSGASKAINVTVSPSSANLSNGTYTGTVTITSSTDGVKSPRHSVNVSLTVQTSQSSGGGSSPRLDVSPSTLSFSAPAGTNKPKAKTLSIRNSGGGTLQWQLSTNANWLTLRPKSGQGSDQVSVTMDPVGLAPNKTHKTTIDVSASGAKNSPVSVQVSVSRNAPKIKVGSNSLTFLSQKGTTPSTQELKISNANGGTLEWKIEPLAPWLQAKSRQGTGDQKITISIDKQQADQLKARKHQGKLRVRSPNASNSPQTVKVTYHVLAAKVYWITTANRQGGAIKTANLHKPHNPVSLYSNGSQDLLSMSGLTLHNGYLYWVEALANQVIKKGKAVRNWRIQRIKLDDQGRKAGSETIAKGPAKSVKGFREGQPFSLAVHENELIWTHQDPNATPATCRTIKATGQPPPDTDAIYKADMSGNLPLQGSDIQQLQRDYYCPAHIAITTTMYSSTSNSPTLLWTTLDKVMRGSLGILRSFTSPTQVTRIKAPQAFSLLESCLRSDCDPKLYWANQDGVQRSNPDGTQVQTVVSSGQFGQNLPSSMAIDRVDEKIYWADQNGLFRANLDGSKMTKLLSSSATNPTSIALLDGKRKGCPIANPLFCGGLPQLPPISPPPTLPVP